MENVEFIPKNDIHSIRIVRLQQWVAVFALSGIAVLQNAATNTYTTHRTPDAQGGVIFLKKGVVNWYAKGFCADLEEAVLSLLKKSNISPQPHLPLHTTQEMMGRAGIQFQEEIQQELIKRASLETNNLKNFQSAGDLITVNVDFCHNFFEIEPTLSIEKSLSESWEGLSQQISNPFSQGELGWSIIEALDCSGTVSKNFSNEPLDHSLPLKTKVTPRASGEEIARIYWANNVVGLCSSRGTSQVLTKNYQFPLGILDVCPESEALGEIVHKMIQGEMFTGNYGATDRIYWHDLDSVLNAYDHMRKKFFEVFKHKSQLTSLNALKEHVICCRIFEFSQAYVLMPSIINPNLDLEDDSLLPEDEPPFLEEFAATKPYCYLPKTSSPLKLGACIAAIFNQAKALLFESTIFWRAQKQNSEAFFAGTWEAPHGKQAVYLNPKESMFLFYTKMALNPEAFDQESTKNKLIEENQILQQYFPVLKEEAQKDFSSIFKKITISYSLVVIPDRNA